MSQGAGEGVCARSRMGTRLMLAPLVHACRVLEIGCGSGFVICSVARMLARLDVQARVVAVDINPEAAAATRQTLENHGVRRAEGTSLLLPAVFSPHLIRPLWQLLGLTFLGCLHCRCKAWRWS